VVHRRDIFGVITDDRFFPSPQLAFHAAEKVAADAASDGDLASIPPRGKRCFSLTSIRFRTLCCRHGMASGHEWRADGYEQMMMGHSQVLDIRLQPSSE
jgi:hypothetical protein